MEDLMWVKIETTKSSDEIWSMKGQISQLVFEGIVSNQLTSGYFKLDKVYWVSTHYDDNGCEYDALYQYGKDKLKAFHGELFMKIEHVVSIAPIDGEMEIARFESTDKNHLSVVSPIRP